MKVVKRNVKQSVANGHPLLASESTSEIVEPTASWLSINPLMGCSLECAYCFREKWGAPSEPYETVNSQIALNALINHSLFRANETPLTVNVSSTDPLLPTVKPVTFNCIKYLDDKKLPISLELLANSCLERKI